MGCVLILVLLGLPRIALVWLWLTQEGYVLQAMGTQPWPFLGFVFFPTATLAFAYSMNAIGGAGVMTPFGWFLTIVALMWDLSVQGGAGRWGSRRKD